MTEDINIEQTLKANSDQLNAADLVRPRTITITKVTWTDSTHEKIDVWFTGDGGKPWRPCLTMRRLLSKVWGVMGSSWVGKSLTIYNDESVTYGSDVRGGIRVSHASGIDKEISVLLPDKRKRKKFSVLPLQQQDSRPPLNLEPATETDAAFNAVIAAMNAATDADNLADIIAAEDMTRFTEDQRNTARELYVARRDALTN